MKVAVGLNWTHNPSDEARWVSRLRENLTSGSDGEGLETGRATETVPRQSFTRQLFFKWIKQNLKIKSFLGNSKNAVLIQIWIALCVYLILSFLKFRSKTKLSLQQIIRLLQMNLFEKMNLDNLVHNRHSRDRPEDYGQMAFL